ncbi:MAG: hypothetical protein JSW32_03995, partial [Deltaproteobacteria bacterium]
GKITLEGGFQNCFGLMFSFMFLQEKLPPGPFVRKRSIAGSRAFDLQKGCVIATQVLFLAGLREPLMRAKAEGDCCM